MLSIKNCFVAIAAAAATSAMAQNLADPLPSPGGPAGPVDKVLADIARNMKPSADLIDAQSRPNQIEFERIADLAIALRKRVVATTENGWQYFSPDRRR